MNIRLLLLLLSLLQFLDSSTQTVLCTNNDRQQEAVDQVEDISSKLCPICDNEIAGEPVKLHGQHSPGCRECLKYNLEVAYNNRGAKRFDQIKCPQNGCKQIITLQEMKLIVGDNELFKKYAAEFEKFSKPIQNNNNFSPDEAKMLSSLGAKKCPSCSSFVQKNGGCLHLDCKCGFKFCWVCENDYTQSGCTAGECKKMPDVTLIDAVKKNEEELVEQLLIKGYDPNQIDEKLMTPLLHAVKNKSKEIVALLLGRVDADGNVAVDVNRADNDGRTPLEYAVYGGDQDIVKKFFEIRKADETLAVDVQQKNILGATLLDVAQVKRNKRAYELLVENGATHGLGLFTHRISATYLTRNTAHFFCLASKLIALLLIQYFNDPFVSCILSFTIGEVIPLLLFSKEARPVLLLENAMRLCLFQVLLIRFLSEVHYECEDVYYNGRSVVMCTSEMLYQRYIRLLFGRD